MKKYLFIALLLCSITAFSQPGKAKTAAPQKITSVEGITEYKLANGLQVLLFPDPSKATMTVNATYLVGSRMEGYGETGMAHLLEHMLFKGSTNHTNVPQELSSHGAQPNGSTWYDRTNYFETFSATEDNLKWALSLESDRMVNSFVAKKDLETEFSVVRNEFEAGENSPSNILQERVMSTAYLWHNYGKSTIGSKEDIEKVSIENLQAFYHKYYQPDNAILTVAGKIDEEKTLALVNEYFGSIPKPTRVIQEPYTVEPVQDGERHVELRRSGDVQVVSAGYHIPAGSHVDYAAVDVLNDVLTNEPSGRLYKALVETKKTTNISGNDFALKDPGYAYYSADVLKEKSLDDAKRAMLNVLDSLKYNPVTEEETERAKTKLLKDVELMFNNSDYVGLTLSEFIAQGDWRLIFLYRDEVEKVTPADVNHVAAAYYKPSNRTTGVFIPDKNPDRAQIPPPPDVNALVKDYKGKAALVAAEAFDASPENIDKRTKNGTIAGGARYAMVSKTTRGNSVNARIQLYVGSVTSLENKSVVAEMTAAMLKKGTKNKSQQQINDALDNLKAHVEVYGGGQNITITIETVREKFGDVLSLVNEIVRQPSFPASEFDKLKEEKLAEIDQQRSDPQSIAFNTMERYTNPYPKTDFRYVMNFDQKAEAVKKAKLEDIKKFYIDFYNSSSANISIVGNFDEMLSTTALTDMLANWNSPMKYERAKDIYFDVASKDEKIKTPDKANAMLAAGYNMELRDDDPDYPALIMGNYMLGGGFLNSRLAERLRQKEGFCYGVGSWLQADAFDKSGSFGSYAIYNPDNSVKLMSAYKEELSKMLKDGFTAAELKDAVSGWLQDAKVNRSQDQVLTEVLTRHLHQNRTMQWSAVLEKKISELTVEQVNSVMKKWIHPEKITFVQAGDFDRKKPSELSK